MTEPFSCYGKDMLGEDKAGLSKDEKNRIRQGSLVEVINLHDDSLNFEPIHRVIEDFDCPAVIEAFHRYLGKCSTAKRVTT